MDISDDLSLSQVEVTVPTTHPLSYPFFLLLLLLLLLLSLLLLLLLLLFVNVHLGFELIFFFKDK